MTIPSRIAPAAPHISPRASAASESIGFTASAAQRSGSLSLVGSSTSCGPEAIALRLDPLSPTEVPALEEEQADEEDRDHAEDEAELELRVRVGRIGAEPDRDADRLRPRTPR